MGLLGWRRLVGATLCLLVTAAAGTTATGLQPYNDTREYTVGELQSTKDVNASLPYRCDFEKDDKFCGMAQIDSSHKLYGGKIEWKRSTNVTKTGPVKAAAGKYFAYTTEGSVKKEDELRTPELIFDHSNVTHVCVSFAFYIDEGETTPRRAPLRVGVNKAEDDNALLNVTSSNNIWKIYNKTVRATGLKHIRFIPYITRNVEGIVAIDHLSVESGGCAKDCDDCALPTTTTTSAPTTPTATTTTPRSGNTVSPGSPTESETTAGSYNTENTPSEGPEKRDALSPGQLGGIIVGTLVGVLLVAVVILMIILTRRKPPATTEEVAELNVEPSGEVSATNVASGTGGDQI